MKNSEIKIKFLNWRNMVRGVIKYKYSSSTDELVLIDTTLMEMEVNLMSLDQGISY